MFSCDPCVLSRMNVRTSLNISAIPIILTSLCSGFEMPFVLTAVWGGCVLNSANPFTHGSQTTANLNCQLHGNQQTHRWVNNPRRRMCKLEPLLNWDALNINVPRTKVLGLIQKKTSSLSMNSKQPLTREWH